MNNSDWTDSDWTSWHAAASMYREWRKAHGKKGNRTAFCHKYHSHRLAMMSTRFGTDEECEAYMRLLKRMAGIDDTRQRPPVTDWFGLNDWGKTQRQKRVKRHPAERADMVYHGSQFMKGEW